MWTSLQEESLFDAVGTGTLATKEVTVDAGETMVEEGVVVAPAQLFAQETTCPSIVAVTQSAPAEAAAVETEVGAPGQLLVQETTCPSMVAVTQSSAARFCSTGTAETEVETASKALSHVKDLADMIVVYQSVCMSIETWRSM